MKRNITRYLNNVTVAMMAILTVVCLQLPLVHAKPGPLAQSPLFLGTPVPPNIFFALDDSGSMDWETTLNEGTWNPGGVADSIVFNSSNGNHRFKDPEGFRSVCLGYNVLAYNPNFVYTPWRGEDEDGLPYTNRTLLTALDNPYDNDSTRNITNHYYFQWTDADNDGEYDGPGSIGYLQGVGAGEECGDLSSEFGAGSVHVNTLPVILNQGDVGYPNSQRNYANWFTYYRKREYVAKRAISELIWNSDDRMGLATLHNNNSVGTPIADMTNNSNKIDLLDELGQVNSTGGTPLRILLRNVGRYFDKAGNNSDHSALGFTNSSPILSAANGGTCQQNFTILFSDGFWNGSSPNVGNDDGDNNSPWDGGSHADAFSNTLADVAMQYYETDLATSLANNVPTTANVDDNSAQHMVTYTVAFGISGTLTMNPPNRTAAFNWPQPTANSPETADDMRHAAWNARGEFLSARNPATLISALEAAINSIADREGSAASVTFNSNSLQAGSQVYLSQFNTSGWTGDVLAFDLDPITGNLASTEAWSAADILDSRDLANNPRNIYTYNDQDGIAFSWSNLTNAQKNDLRTEPSGIPPVDDTAAQARLAFIAGDRNNEGAGLNFRTRSSLLGDIVHSAPLFIGPPVANYPDADPFGSASKRYSTFFTDSSVQNRKQIVYAGSNDGLMHAFDASSGDEEFSYIPNFLFDTNPANGLHYLTDPNYSHTYYVDLSTTANEVFIKTSPSGTRNWRTVLVGGARAGGRGLYALDVTDPNDFTGNAADIRDVVLWEFDSTDDADLGFTFSEPTVVMLNNGQWGVIVGNGYNSTGTGEASVFIMLLEGNLDSTASGVNGNWALNTNYYKLTTGVGSIANPNGMSMVTVADLDNNRTIDRIYAGDLEGNLWAFDISDANPSNWESAYKSGNTPEPLFNTVSNLPITVKPAVTRLATVPTTPQNFPNVMVYFGTGQYLTTTDNTDTTKHHFYGVWDTGNGNGNLDANNLVQQTLSTDPAQADARFVTNNPVAFQSAPSTSSGADFGWYFELLDVGERVIVDPVVRAGLVFFATLIPDNQVCSQGGGSGFIMAVKTTNGGQPPTSTFDFNNDGIVDAGDQCSCGQYAAGQKFQGKGIPSGLSFLGNKLYISDTGSTTQVPIPVPDPNPNSTGRLSWQEIVIE